MLGLKSVSMTLRWNDVECTRGRMRWMFRASDRRYGGRGFDSYLEFWYLYPLQVTIIYSFVHIRSFVVCLASGCSLLLMHDLRIHNLLVWNPFLWRQRCFIRFTYLKKEWNEQTIVFEARLFLIAVISVRPRQKKKIYSYLHISWLKMQVCFLFQTRNKTKILTKTAFERKINQIKIGPTGPMMQNCTTSPTSLPTKSLINEGTGQA